MDPISIAVSLFLNGTGIMDDAKCEVQKIFYEIVGETTQKKTGTIEVDGKTYTVSYDNAECNKVAYLVEIETPQDTLSTIEEAAEVYAYEVAPAPAPPVEIQDSNTGFYEDELKEPVNFVIYYGINKKERVQVR